ncbi:hypothetical protein L1887_56891 [Cichorium endivia]|nr:hypothetical protein L1887_56891 [Cichorium endivia]
MRLRRGALGLATAASLVDGATPPTGVVSEMLMVRMRACGGACGDRRAASDCPTQGLHAIGGSPTRNRAGEPNLAPRAASFVRAGPPSASFGRASPDTVIAISGRAYPRALDGDFGSHFHGKLGMPVGRQLRLFLDPPPPPPPQSSRPRVESLLCVLKSSTCGDEAWERSQSLAIGVYEMRRAAAPCGLSMACKRS